MGFAAGAPEGDWQTEGLLRPSVIPRGRAYPNGARPAQAYNSPHLRG